VDFGKLCETVRISFSWGLDRNPMRGGRITSEEKTSISMYVGVIIAVVLIAGGLYIFFLAQKINGAARQSRPSSGLSDEAKLMMMRPWRRRTQALLFHPRSRSRRTRLPAITKSRGNGAGEMKNMFEPQCGTQVLPVPLRSRLRRIRLSVTTKSKASLAAAGWAWFIAPGKSR